MRVLVIERDEPLARRFAQDVAGGGFRCDVALSLASADGDLEAVHYDAVILDLPDAHDAELAWLARCRRRPDFPPILAMTASDEVCDRIASLDAGADDCLVKTADATEVAARLRALLRRPGPRSPPVLHVGDLKYDVAARRLHHHEVEIVLTHKEAELLELLMRKAGTVVRKSVITDALYGYDDDITPNAIEALVSRLRHKLGALGSAGAGAGPGAGGSPLDTVRGLGYILNEGPR